MRENSQKNLELEVRIGQFTSENDFISGYSAEFMSLITRMLKRLQKNTEVLKSTWKMVEPKYTMLRCEFDRGLRKTARPNFEEEYITKKRIGKIDILTDRQYHLRISLSEETKVDMVKSHPMYEVVKKQAPKSLRYIQRASFLEVIPAIHPSCTCGGQIDPERYFLKNVASALKKPNFDKAELMALFERGLDQIQKHRLTVEKSPLPFTICENCSIVFQWDISKVSAEAPTKKKSTENPCTYHCEIELKTKLFPIEDKTVQAQQNALIADLLIARGRALLGTSVLDSNHQPQPLPPAKLLLINKDV